MGKDNALGYDPLSWMKIVNENKKLISLENENTLDVNSGESDLQTSSQTMIKQPIAVSTNSEGTSDATKVQQPIGKINSGADNITMPKPKVEIGRLYEKPSIEKVKSIQRNECVSQGVRHYTEPSFPGLGTIQPNKKAASKINRLSISTAVSHFSTYIIIAYTALMLILGYFVYNDLSKRTSKIEARIFAIEKLLRAK